MIQPYILTWWQNDGSDSEKDKIGLTGPFANSNEAVVWGEGWDRENSNPNWQLVELDSNDIEVDSTGNFLRVEIEAA